MTAAEAGQRFRISDAALAAARVRDVTDAEARDLLGQRGFRDCDLGGVAFTYRHPLTGAVVGHRVRLDHLLPEGGKYIMTHGCRWLFIAPVPTEWLSDVTVQVVLVENEKSALAVSAAAERAGIPLVTIATGGCWGWKRKDGFRDLPEGGHEPVSAPSPTLDLLPWDGRETIIAFDADGTSNPSVAAALRALAVELGGRGASVRIATVPPEAGPKAGPDDVIEKCSDAAALAMLSTAAPWQRPVITLSPGEAPEAVDAAEKLLVDNADKLRIYQRAGEVVRIIELDAAMERGPVRKQAGTIQLGAVSAINLTEELDKLATWQRERVDRDGSKEHRRIDCPARIPMAYLARIGTWKLPPLAGVIAAPIMRNDGTILSAPGYDAATGLFLTGGAWPEIPSSPTGEDVRRALAVLNAPFAEFPFVGPEDRSVLRAAILTALQRRLLQAAPLFGFTAHVMRSGKSLLSEAVGIITTGQPAPAMAVSGDRDEIRKAVASILREGHAVVNLDNIDHPLGSPDLARAITQPEYADRILGETRLLRLPTNITWLATGNNLAFKGDLAVRVVLCRLDAGIERPEERTFTIPDLKAHIASHRQELVAAALTILRAYHVAGRPDQHLPAWGGFDEWSALIRAALVWLGEADPCATRQHVIEDDPDREQAETLLGAWARSFGEQAVQLGAVVKRSDSEPDLLSAVLAVAASKNDPHQPDARRLGWWCRENTGRIVGGLKLSRERGESHSGATWRVIGILGVPPPQIKTQKRSADHIDPEKMNSGEGCETPRTPDPRAAGVATADVAQGVMV